MRKARAKRLIRHKQIFRGQRFCKRHGTCRNERPSRTDCQSGFHSRITARSRWCRKPGRRTTALSAIGLESERRCRATAQANPATNMLLAQTESRQRHCCAGMKEPEFDVAYREAKRKAFCQSIARLQQSNGRRCHDLTEGHSAAAVRAT